MALFPPEGRLKALQTLSPLVVTGPFNSILKPSQRPGEYTACATNNVVFFFFYRMLIIENFIPHEEKNKILNRSEYEDDTDQWVLKALARSEG